MELLSIVNLSGGVKSVDRQSVCTIAVSITTADKKFYEKTTTETHTQKKEEKKRVEVEIKEKIIRKKMRSEEICL